MTTFKLKIKCTFTNFSQSTHCMYFSLSAFFKNWLLICLCFVCLTKIYHFVILNIVFIKHNWHTLQTTSALPCQPNLEMSFWQLGISLFLYLQLMNMIKNSNDVYFGKCKFKLYIWKHSIYELFDFFVCVAFCICFSTQLFS